MVFYFNILIHQQYLEKMEVINDFPKDRVRAIGILTNELTYFFKGIVPMGKVKVEEVDSGPIDRMDGEVICSSPCPTFKVSRV